MPCNPGKKWNERRQIDVAESEMVGASKEIQRVAEITVARGRGHMEGEINQGNEVDPRPQRGPRRGVVANANGRGGQRSASITTESRRGNSQEGGA